MRYSEPFATEQGIRVIFKAKEGDIPCTITFDALTDLSGEVEMDALEIFQEHRNQIEILFDQKRTPSSQAVLVTTADLI